MDARTQTLFEARARILKAMAHPTRLYIVDQLSRAEHCVGDLQELVGADVSTVSKHLAVLNDAGLLTRQKRGNQVFYSLTVPCVMNFFGCIEAVLQTSARQTMDLVR
jgi:DNA-binding transcriptional ArsR family regulator